MKLFRSVLGMGSFLGGAMYARLESFFFAVYMKWTKQSHIVLSARCGFASTLGSYVYIGHNSAITKASIGNYCSIASNVSIGMGEHALDKISTNSMFYPDAYATLTEKPCTLGHDVWVGVGAVIRRGVYVGNGAVIGANSFVNKDVPPYAIVVGSPAKVIKYRFTPEQIEKIENSHWRNHDLQTSRHMLQSLQSKIS